MNIVLPDGSVKELEEGVSTEADVDVVKAGEKIGRVLGVTESRICQMHTKAVLQLRAKLAEDRKSVV